MIILKNISNHDKFDYPLIQIRGNIINYCYCPKIVVCNITSDTIIEWPITCYGYFKVFCDLLTGVNVLKLQCSHYNVKLSVNHIRNNVVDDVEVMLIECTNKEDHIDVLSNQKVMLAVRMVQCFLGESLFCGGFAKHSFLLRDNVKRHRTRLTVDECLNKTERELWSIFAREIMELYPDQVAHTKWIAFLNSTRYCPPSNTIPTDHSDVIRFTRGHCALGASGLALLGTGTLYSLPSKLQAVSAALLNCAPVDRAHLMDDSAFRGVYWANYSTFLGTILHEFGHCLGLGHSRVGIMRRGGDDINVALFFEPGQTSAGAGSTGHCQHCSTRNVILAQRREVSKLCTEKNFVLSRCKSLNHSGQCFWSPNNLIMLNYHKWLTHSDPLSPASASSQSPFTITKHSVTGINRLILVEIRTRHPNNVCVGYRSFCDQNIFEQTFSGKRMCSLIKEKSAIRDNESFVLVVMDIVGNIVSVECRLRMDTLDLELLDSTMKVVD